MEEGKTALPDTLQGYPHRYDNVTFQPEVFVGDEWIKINAEPDCDAAWKDIEAWREWESLFLDSIAGAVGIPRRYLGKQLMADIDEAKADLDECEDV